MRILDVGVRAGILFVVVDEVDELDPENCPNGILETSFSTITGELGSVIDSFESLLDFLLSDFFPPFNDDDEDFLRPKRPRRSLGLWDVVVVVGAVVEGTMPSRMVDSIDQRDRRTGDCERRGVEMGEVGIEIEGRDGNCCPVSSLKHSVVAVDGV